MNDGRIALWLCCASFLFFLLFHHGHFKGSDELAIFEMTRSLHERGDLAVPPLKHTDVGVDGRRYSYFSPGQSVLALPLFALASPLSAILPDTWQRGLAGPRNHRGPYRFGGELEATLVGLFAPLVTALLVALFFLFQREIGVQATTASLVAIAFATTTHTATLSTYFLRHSTEAITILAALLLFRRYAHGPATAPLGVLVLASALASLTFLVRVPAALAAPTFAGYLAYALTRQREWSAGAARLAKVLAAILVPLFVAIAIHVAINEARWGTLWTSPMVEQDSRFNHPIWRGLAGLLLSPGSSVFVYSPLLLLSPLALAALWRRDRALALALLAMAAVWLLFYAGFDGWSGLWSAPGPRYLYLLVPLGLLPVGLWLDAPPARLERSTRLGLFAGLSLLGLGVQVVSTLVRWGSVPTLAAYPILAPDQASFLFEWSRSPVVVMARLLAEGGPIDSWLWNLWNGWPGFAPRPAAVIALLAGWAAAFAGCAIALGRALHRASRA